MIGSIRERGRHSAQQVGRTSSNVGIDLEKSNGWARLKNVGIREG